jgi:hypothetical protein
MNQRTELSVKKGIINAFGSFGYLFCFLQWFWAIILYLSVIQTITLFISPSSGKQIEQSSGFTFTLPGPLGMVILAVVVTLMVIITIYALISIPRNIVKTSNNLVHKTAETIAPLVIKARHKKDTKRFRITITSRLTLVIKVLLILIPLMLTTMSILLEEQPIDYSIAKIVGYGLAGFSVAAFAIQYLLAGLLRVKMSDLW